MVSKKKLAYFFVAPVMVINLLSGCGGDQTSLSATTPIVYQGTVYYPNATPTDNQCCCCCDNTVVTKPATTKTPIATKTSAPSITKTPEPARASAPPSTVDDKAKGRKILDKVLATITTPNAIEVEVEKWEKGLKNGVTVQQVVKVYDKKPGKVKMDIISHSKASNVGAKLTFDFGTGKATIRPGGALSFITKEMDQTDKNLITPNGFTPEQIDFFYITKRLSSSSYDAELMGKTTINGSEVYLLKIIKNGTNELSPDIKYEVMGFDLKTFEVKSWELYSDNSGNPFFRVTIKSFKALSDIPDSTFKV